jgi:hypothetical protein
MKWENILSCQTSILKMANNNQLNNKFISANKTYTFELKKIALERLKMEKRNEVANDIGVP